MQAGIRVLHVYSTTLLKVTEDIIFDGDKGYGSILVLLDVSKALDTFDHNMLLSL